MVKIVKNCQNRQKWSKSPKMVQNGSNWSKIIPNGPKWSKLSKIVKKKHGQSGLKWSKMLAKGAKDEVKTPEEPPARSWAPEGPLNF